MSSLRQAKVQQYQSYLGTLSVAAEAVSSAVLQPVVALKLCEHLDDSRILRLDSDYAQGRDSRERSGCEQSPEVRLPVGLEVLANHGRRSAQEKGGMYRVATVRRT